MVDNAEVIKGIVELVKQGANQETVTKYIDKMGVSLVNIKEQLIVELYSK